MNDVKAEAVVSEVVKLPVVDRVWPNFLGRAICHSGLFDVKLFSSKLAKSVCGKEIIGFESRVIRSLLMKDKGKKVEVALIETLVDDISSYSSRTPSIYVRYNSLCVYSTYVILSLNLVLITLCRI